MTFYKDAFTAEERIREYLDLEKCAREIEKSLLACPAAFPEGVDIADKENDFTLSMYVDDQGVYCAVTHDGQRKGITLEECIELMQRHYLLHNDGLEILMNAVYQLGEKTVLPLGKGKILLTPEKNDVMLEMFH